MAGQYDITLAPVTATDAITLRAMPAAVVADRSVPITLYSNPTADITLRPLGVVEAVFPTQYAGFRTFYGGVMKELCLVATVDAPASMGGVIKLRKGVQDYAVYLVETTDPNASNIRIRTSTGTKAIRLKT